MAGGPSQQDPWKKGGPYPEHEEITFTGPFTGTEWNNDAYFAGRLNSAYSIDYDNRYGVIQQRPGVQSLLEWKELNTGGVITQFRLPVGPTGNLDESLMFANVATSMAPTKSDYTNYGWGTDGLVDAVAVGRWWQRDALLRPRYSAPPTEANWGGQRYKVIYLGGKARFTNGSRTVSLLAGGARDPLPVIDQFIVGGYIRDCEFGYSSMKRIVAVSGTLNSIILDSNWTFGNGDHYYAIFLPISDANSPNPDGPEYRTGCDYTPLPLLYSTSRVLADINGSGGFVDAENLGTNPEFTRIAVHWGDPWDPVLEPGMTFRLLTEAVDAPHGIVRVDAPDKANFVQYAYIWPPIPTPSLPVAGAKFEVMGPQAYWVTGAPGSTIVTPGAAPVMGQVLDNPSRDYSYVATCATVFGNRVLIGTNESYRGVTYRPINVAGVFGFIPTPGNKVAHPGRLAWSQNGDYRRFQGVGARWNDLQIGPILHLFTMRDRAYAIGENEIVEISTTGQLSQPFAYRPLGQNKQFVSWAKPVIVDATRVLIFCWDGVYLFDGSSLTPTSRNIAEHYRNLVVTGTQTPLPNHGFFEQMRRRVLFARGEQSALYPKEVLALDLDDGEALAYALPAYTGGFARWTTYGATDPTTQAITRGHDVECLVHSVGRSVRPTNTDHDWISAFRWGIDYDNNGAQDPTKYSIPGRWTTPWFSMDGQRWNKEISRIRLAYRITSTTTQQVNVVLRQQDGTFFAQTIDFAVVAGTIGMEAQAFVTGTPGNPLIITDALFRLEFEMGVNAPQTAAGRPNIQEIGVTFLKKPEVAEL